MKRIELCRFVDGDTVFSTEATALLLGVTVEQLHEVWDPNDGPAALPAPLQRKGHKRAQAARDATGENSGNVAVAYWAVCEWGARLDYDERAMVMWAVIDQEPAG